MRESNFSSPALNRACVCITPAVYDRRAIDSTSTLPLINSLNHLAYLTSTSPRIREMVTLDGGLERLVQILQRVPSAPSPSKPATTQLIRSIWKWSLAFQCAVNIGVRGTEPVRIRVVDAGMVPITVNVLESYLTALDQAHAQERAARHAEKQAAAAAAAARAAIDAASAAAAAANDSTAAALAPFGVTPAAHPPPSSRSATSIPDEFDPTSSSTSSASSSSIISSARRHAIHPSDALLLPPTSSSAEQTQQQQQQQQQHTSTHHRHHERRSRSSRHRHSNKQPRDSSVDSSRSSSALEEDEEEDHNNYSSSSQSEQTEVRPMDVTYDDVDAGGLDIRRTFEDATNVISSSVEPPSAASAGIDGSGAATTGLGMGIPSRPLPSIIYREEEVLLSLQLLAYVSKYPHVRELFHCPEVMEGNMPEWYTIVASAAMTNRADSASSSSSSATPTAHGEDDAQRKQQHQHQQQQQQQQAAAATAELLSKYATPRKSWSPHAAQRKTVFSIAERFTFKSSSTLRSSATSKSSRLAKDIQYWASVIMRNACRKDDSRQGVRQCANMLCGKWEKFPREFAKCRRCRKAKYCSKQCQSKGWAMGHKHWCNSAKDDVDQDELVLGEERAAQQQQQQQQQQQTPEQQAQQAQHQQQRAEALVYRDRAVDALEAAAAAMRRPTLTEQQPMDLL